MNEGWPRVDFNPRDESPYALGLIVSASTGVIYANQCGGLECFWKEMEGYLAVVGGADRAQPFLTYFAERFGGRPPHATEWLEEDLRTIEDLVYTNVVHLELVGEPEREERVPVQLDRARLTDLTEAWIPVHVGTGIGALVFANSD